jgi:uncharacterized protein YndB with AHSA1/START domain
MTHTESTLVHVSHTFSASPERVFDAWLDPTRLGKWMFATPGGEMIHVAVEPEVGGCFNVTERRNGEDVEHIGEFVEIDRPRRLVFLFQVPKYGPDRDRVIVDIVPAGAGCTVTITHELAPKDLEMKDGVVQGWTEILEGLDRVMAERS